MTYGKPAAYGSKWSQGQRCCCTKGPSITTWICHSTDLSQQEGQGSPTSLAPHKQIHSTSSAPRERDIVRLNCGALIWCFSRNFCRGGFCDVLAVTEAVCGGLLGWMAVQSISVFPQSECYKVNGILNWHELVEIWIRCCYPALQSAVNQHLMLNWSIKCFQMLPSWAVCKR